MPGTPVLFPDLTAEKSLGMERGLVGTTTADEILTPDFFDAFGKMVMNEEKVRQMS